MSEEPFNSPDYRYRRYIGDGVYAAHDGFQVWLSTGEPVLGIALEPETMYHLIKYANEVADAHRADSGIPWPERRKNL